MDNDEDDSTWEPAAASIYSELENEILNGQLAGGTVISEPTLSRRFGVSRAPLREAIWRLVRRGLLVRPPRQRARVATVTQEEINQVLHLREAVEGLSAREAAKHITTEEIASLRAALARQEERSRAVGAEALVQHEPGLDFHAAIASASRNVFVLKFLQEDFYAMVELCRRRQRRDPCGMPARSSITVVSSTPWRIAILNSPSY